MSERRYSEAEVAEIFRLAAELENLSPRALMKTDGMTLAELQQIGVEAGMSSDLVARAAQAHAATGTATTARLAGLPIGVGRTIELDRRVSDREWEQLVSELRETFNAKGRLEYNGPFRQWSNGNLHVLLEPTETGTRLRFRTRNGLSQTLLASGLGTLGMGAVLAVIGLLGGDTGTFSPASIPGVLWMTGGAMAAFGGLRLPGWAQRRREQMEALARRVALRRSIQDDVAGKLPPGDDQR